MNRRQVCYLGLGLGASLLSSPSGAQKPNPLSLTWLGHMSFLFQDGKRRILSHPFKSVGCNAGLPSPQREADLVIVSSSLLDEGFIDNIPDDVPILKQPGSYNLLGITFQGIRMAHDRVQGRRFGFNVAWRWQQGGVGILHLGGAAAPFQPEERILMGRPDILIVPVGGGAKAYDPEGAKAAVMSLNPKITIPVHYRRAKADPNVCDLQPLTDFLTLFPDSSITKLKTNTMSLLPQDLPPTMKIMVFGESTPPKQPKK